MEATISIAPLYRRLAGEGYEVHIAHPKETRTIAKARIKTDWTSSRALAELLRLNCLPESYFPPPEIALRREKVRRRAFLVRQQTKLKVKVQSVLTYEGIEPRRTTASSPGGVWNGWRGWAWTPSTATSG